MLEIDQSAFSDFQLKSVHDPNSVDHHGRLARLELGWLLLWLPASVASSARSDDL
jgi:hypothetical protein